MRKGGASSPRLPQNAGQGAFVHALEAGADEPEMGCSVPSPIILVRMPHGAVLSALVAWMHGLVCAKRDRHERWKRGSRKAYKAAKRRENRKARGDATARGEDLELKRERKAAAMRRYRARLKAGKAAIRRRAGSAMAAVEQRKALADERRRRRVEREERAKGIY